MEKLFNDIEYSNKSIEANEQGKFLYQYIHEVDYEIAVPEYEKKEIEVPIYNDEGEIIGYETIEVDDLTKPIMIEVIDEETGETILVQKTHQETRTKEVCELLIDDEFKYIIFDGNFTRCEANPDYEDDVRTKLGLLCMTPLDFIKCLEEKGLTYQTVKALCNQNTEVDKQLNYCNHVFRGNELLDQLAGQFGITSDELDEMFINNQSEV